MAPEIRKETFLTTRISKELKLTLSLPVCHLLIGSHTSIATGCPKKIVLRLCDYLGGAVDSIISFSTKLLSNGDLARVNLTREC